GRGGRGWTGAARRVGGSGVPSTVYATALSALLPMSIPMRLVGLQVRVDDEAGVREHGGAGQVAGVVAQEECDHIRHLLGLADPVEGDALLVVLEGRRVGEEGGCHRRVDAARLDGVYSDAVLAEDWPERFGEHAHAGLRAAVRDLRRRTDMRRQRAGAADRAAVPLLDHLLRALGDDEPGAAEVGLRQLVEVFDR